LTRQAALVTPIQVHRDAAAAERLRKVMAPFMLRRLKSDKSIISDLPDKVEQDQFCTLSRRHHLRRDR
jgi:SNF2 family DNA or RNA helicase